jgi:predicted dienelactone hydrolase
VRDLGFAFAAAIAVVALAELGAARHTARWRRGIGTAQRPRLAPSAIAGLLAVATALIVQAIWLPVTWQMVPALIGSVILLALTSLRLLGTWVPLRRTASICALLGGAITAAALWALPIVILSPPTGPHAVGTTTLTLRDLERVEQYGPAPGGPREIVVQLWYPADPAAERAAGPLMPEADAFVPAGAPELGIPAFALGHLRAIPGHATRDVAALDEQLPIVVLSHGWTGFRVLQADLAEQLASRGFVVAAIEHTFGALVTTFPDGRSVPFDPAALPEFGSIADDDYARLSRALLATFRDDQLLTVAALETRPPTVLEGRLDLGRLAFIGHSTGGGAAVMACAAEPRCRAVVGFDPWVLPTAPGTVENGIAAPLLTLRTESWRDVPNEVALTTLHDAQRSRGVREILIGLDGALHRDFTLIGALSPLAPLLDLEGATPGAATRLATLTWTERFLEHHVLGVGDDPASDPPVGLPTGRIERVSP